MWMIAQYSANTSSNANRSMVMLPLEINVVKAVP